MFCTEPSDERLTQYYGDPSKAGVVLSMIWLVIGFTVGDWVAWQLVNPDPTFGGDGEHRVADCRSEQHRRVPARGHDVNYPVRWMGPLASTRSSKRAQRPQGRLP